MNLDRHRGILDSLVLVVLGGSDLFVRELEPLVRIDLRG